MMTAYLGLPRRESPFSPHSKEMPDWGHWNVSTSQNLDITGSWKEKRVLKMKNKGIYLTKRVVEKDDPRYVTRRIRRKYLNKKCRPNCEENLWPTV